MYVGINNSLGCQLAPRISSIFTRHPIYLPDLSLANSCPPTALNLADISWQIPLPQTAFLILSIITTNHRHIFLTPADSFNSVDFEFAYKHAFYPNAVLRVIWLST